MAIRHLFIAKWNTLKEWLASLGQDQYPFITTKKPSENQCPACEAKDRTIAILERLLELERQELVRVNKRIARRAGLIAAPVSSNVSNLRPILQRNTPSMVRRKLEQAARRQADSPVLTNEEMNQLIKDKEAAVGIGES